MESQDLLYKVEDKIATITLNRPDKMNATTAEMYKKLVELFDQADNDDNVRVIVVTGNGKAFCAGADLSSGDKFGQGVDDIEEYRDRGGVVGLRIYQLNKPCIAAINGTAVGIGITMTLPMDIRIASNKAKIGFVFTRRGLVGEACSNYFLPRIVGMAKALQWVMTGRIISAQEGFDAGLFTEITEPEDVLETAYKYAREIADNTAPLSVALTRRLMWDAQDAPHPMAVHEYESRCMFFLGKSRDLQEGVAAFFEKRPPQWSMSTTKDMPPFFPFRKAPTFHGK